MLLTHARLRRDKFFFLPFRLYDVKPIDARISCASVGKLVDSCTGDSFDVKVDETTTEADEAWNERWG